MSGWKELTSETVLNALPTDMGNLYRSWVDANPSKVNRLAEIVAETVNMFREAVSVYPWYVMDPDLAKVPDFGFSVSVSALTESTGMTNNKASILVPIIFFIFFSNFNRVVN